MSEIKVTLKRSGIGRNKYFTKVLNGLGLRRLQQTVVLKDTPEIRGMINKVSHMVTVEE
ncbi:MAG: 50S ribosomal protein L30 [Desulfuromonadales bacterium]|jgi:large subunit ribosomal protein L30|nr:50S ribosomal protein L30 [Desulfuromonadales bacterium]MDH3807541.1 50S ribosomal protein L30 [Desulfuromonadales bacterium]MDH3867931.1 50S ribosomal protein L30 [Desulfuromonadales bacterium]MDH3959831.1 50S ribosomal protein L30 [Desulfuromonadales bacterium]MDH4024918.1 50S ribosomal protein L30 [Desulfuromonadales bacterium]